MKYRIVGKNRRFYPQMKVLFFWVGISEIVAPYGGYTSCYHTKEEAKKRIKEEKKSRALRKEIRGVGKVIYDVGDMK